MANNLQGDVKMIFIIFIGVIIAAVFLADIANSTFAQTTTGSSVNQTVVVPAINTSTALAGREVLGTPTIINVTDIDLDALGLTVDTRTVGGVLTVALTTNDTATALVGQNVNVTYNFNPDGYISDSGARSINLLIPLFAALAILVFSIVVMIKEGSFGEIMRNNFRRREN